jgi:hypothetical protein
MAAERPSGVGPATSQSWTIGKRVSTLTQRWRKSRDAGISGWTVVLVCRRRGVRPNLRERRLVLVKVEQTDRRLGRGGSRKEGEVG